MHRWRNGACSPGIREFPEHSLNTCQGEGKDSSPLSTTTHRCQRHARLPMYPTEALSMCAVVQPQHPPGIPSGKMALAREKSKGEKKRLIFPGLHRKPIRSLTRDLLCSQRPHAPSEWSEDAEHLLDWVLEERAKKVNSESLCAQRNLPEKKRERERKNVIGRPSLGETGLQLYFQKVRLYPRLHISRSERYKVMQNQLNIPSVLPLMKPGHFLHNFPQTRFLCRVHYLLALWPVNIL